MTIFRKVGTTYLLMVVKSAGKLSTILEESIEYPPILIKENRLDLQTLGSQPMIMPKNLPDHWSQLALQALLRPRDIRENSDARPSGHSRVRNSRIIWP